MKNLASFLLLALLVSVILVACNSVQNTPADNGEPISAALEPGPTTTSALRTTSSELPLTTTSIPSQIPSITLTPTPTHPLMVEGMREQDYPGSKFTFEETLQNGANYDQHIISYQSDGNKIYALFTVPWGEIPPSGWPVIIFNHGYIPPEQYRTTERYVNYVDVLARNGYIVFRSDYRGHGSSEGEAKSSYQSPGYTADVLNALESVKTYPNADPDRIGMWGHSMGGNITLRAMVVSEEIKAGVIWGGVVVSYPDMFEYWWGTDNRNISTPDPNTRRGAWRLEWTDVYGTFEENPEFWASISSNSYLEDLSGPLQLHHGTADTSVPHILSEILYNEVTAIGLPIELFLYNGDNHNISINFWTAMQHTVEFFDLHVKGSVQE